MVLNDKKLLLQKLLEKCSPFIFSDSLYLKLIFKVRVGYFPDLKNPKTFNEKLNWLKLNYHNPIMPKLADKYAVKKIVAEKIGVQYVVPNLGVWERFDDIDFDRLPGKFVLKTTNDSMGVIVCKDKKTFDREAAKKVIEAGQRRNYFYAKREWGYKDVERKIIADQFLEDGTGEQLRDYKFWCFNGEPKYMYYTIKGKDVYENFYDMDFNVVNVNHGFPRHQPEFEKPVAFEEMKSLAFKMSEGLPFSRIDFFYVDGKIYFGEVTFYDWAGLRSFESYEMDLELGKLLDLSKAKL